jgi:hypothetical protein
MVSPDLEKLLTRAQQARPQDPRRSLYETERRRLGARIAELDRQIQAAQRNLAIEEDADLRAAIKDEYRRIQAERAETDAKLAALPQAAPEIVATPEEEVEAALALLDQIDRVISHQATRSEALLLFQRLGLRIGLRFIDGVKGKKRRVRRLAGGLIAFGNSPLALGGKTETDICTPSDGGAQNGRDPLSDDSQIRQDRQETETAFRDNSCSMKAGRSETCPRDGVSFTKGSRGDWTPVKLFLQGAASIPPAIQRLISAFLQGTLPQN